MFEHINKMTHFDCPLCDAKLTLRKNRMNNTLFLGCSTYQTSKCPGSLPLDDDTILEVRAHFESLNAPRQMSLLDKGNLRAFIRLHYQVHDADDGDFDTIIEMGSAEVSLDNLLSDLHEFSGKEILESLLQRAVDNIRLA